MRGLSPSIRAVLPLLIVMAGCGRQPQVAPAHRELVVSLATAVSAREPDWLSRNERQIDEQHNAGTMTDDEYRTFRSIVDQAKSGDWDSAEAAVYALRDAQEPTAEDRSKSAERHQGDHPAPAKIAPRPPKRR